MPKDCRSKMGTHVERGEQGYYVKTKPRLVAKGFSQVVGADYNETTSPTPTAAPAKMIAAVTNEKGLPVYHLDKRVSDIRKSRAASKVSVRSQAGR